MKLTSVFLCIPLCAQVPIPPPGTNDQPTFVTTATARKLVMITVSQQPLSVFVAALGSKLPNVAGYSTRLCSLPGGSFSGGMAAQWIESAGLSIVPIQLAAIAAQDARTHSKLFTAATSISQIAYYLSLAMSGGIIPVGTVGLAAKAIRLAPVIVSHEAEAARDKLAARLPDPAERFKGQVLSDADVTLQPGQCSTLLFLGAYVRGFKTLSGTFDAR